MFATEPQNDENPKPLADIVREETDDGRLVVRFLIDVMQGKVDDSKPCHRLDAARQLLNLGFDGAHSRHPVRLPVGQRPRAFTRPSNSRLDQGLADIIKLETSDGRDAVRFLVDVMQGNLQDFKPHHRIAAAKELLRRGFDNTPGHSADVENQDHDESFDDDDPRTPEQRDPSSPNYVDRYAHLYNKEDDPFDFENYDEEQYRRDGHGGRALRHIYGSTETMIVAIDAANHSRTDAGIPKRDFTPVDNPEDDPYGKGCYGYNALSFYFHDDVAIRAANKAVEEYKKRKAERPEEQTNNEGPPIDRPSCCYPQPTASSSEEDDDTLPPDHWSRPYLERIRNSSTEADESSKDPDPDESEPIQPPENSHTSESEPDQSPENPDPGQSKSHKLSDAKDPPKKRPVKIYLGPPDDSPRQCRDPGDFQSAIDSIWSAGIFADQ